MREHLKKIRKIPIPVSIIFFIFVLAVGFFSLDQSRQFLSQALSKNPPEQIKITNINDTSFVVSWITQEKIASTISFGETLSLGETKKDQRDTGQSLGSYYTHYFLIDNLKPQKKYYFKIIAGGRTYDNTGKPFETTTGPTITPLESDLSQGKILTSSGKPAANTIVYLSVADSVTQSALTDTEGNWVIPLSLTRTTDLQNFLNYDQTSQIIQIFVQGEKEVSNATLTTNIDNPVPEISLGQNYNFLNQPKETTPTPETLINQLEFNSAGSTPPAGFKDSQILTISYPSDDERVTSQIPEFFGSGPKNIKLDIVIESESILNDSALIDTQGKWKWSPKKPFALGSHKITVSYLNKNGFVEKVSRNFSVLDVENSSIPSFTATGSATPRPTFPPAIKSPTPTQKPTSTPPQTVKLSITPTLAPTIGPISPTPTEEVILPTPTEIIRTTMPSTGSGVYKSGTTLPTILLVVGGILIFIVGLALAFF